MESIQKNILVLGVTGSIAAYKAADLCSRLRQSGREVRVIMTESATHLVAPQTFLTLSKAPVTISLWDAPSWQPRHIQLALETKLLVIAPATANILAKMAHGIADDSLSTFYLSHEGPVLVAPAMNPRMWRHPATQENIRILKERGVHFVGPACGHVACGDEEGPGRMCSVEEILDAIQKIWNA
jgi:phosphopantothenoylcysteine decarboxylase